MLFGLCGKVQRGELDQGGISTKGGGGKRSSWRNVLCGVK